MLQKEAEIAYLGEREIDVLRLHIYIYLRKKERETVPMCAGVLIGERERERERETVPMCVGVLIGERERERVCVGFSQSTYVIFCWLQFNNV